jgi:hypothetical protein
MPLPRRVNWLRFSRCGRGEPRPYAVTLKWYRNRVAPRGKAVQGDCPSIANGQASRVDERTVHRVPRRSLLHGCPRGSVSV